MTSRSRKRNSRSPEHDYYDTAHLMYDSAILDTGTVSVGNSLFDDEPTVKKLKVTSGFDHHSVNHSAFQLDSASTSLQPLVVAPFDHYNSALLQDLDKQKQKQFNCSYDDCDSILKSQNSLNHTHHTVKCPYPECNDSLLSEDLEIHIARHKKDIQIYDCPYDPCGSQFASQASLEDHIESHHIHTLHPPKAMYHYEFVSPVQKSLCLDDPVQNHYQVPHHLAPQPRNPVSTSSMGTSKKNIAKGDRCYPCTYAGCESVFTRKAVLQRHVSTVHLKEKPFKCTFDDTCTAAFSHKDKLTRHISAVHKKEKPYPCTWDGCNKTFSRKHHVKEHIITVHEKEKHFVCKYDGCDMAFFRRRFLDKHVTVVHLNQSPYKCDLCHASFPMKTNWKKHLANVHHLTTQSDHHTVFPPPSIPPRPMAGAARTMDVSAHRAMSHHGVGNGGVVMVHEGVGLPPYD